jgi:hypothetical protein
MLHTMEIEQMMACLLVMQEEMDASPATGNASLARRDDSLSGE